jgi:ketosteroid isomerase-like protein
MAERPAIEIAADAYECWNRGDMDGLRELYHDDVVFHHIPGWPEPGPSVGRDAVFRQFEDLRGAWAGDEMSFEVVAARPDRLVGRQQWSATGAESGVDTRLDLYIVAFVSGGRIKEIRFCRERDEALQAAGLEVDG